MWGDEWNHVLQHTLGVIDGSEEARSIRESAGDERWVAVDLQALAPQYSSDIQVVAGHLGLSPNTEEGDAEEGGTEAEEPLQTETNLIKLITERFVGETETAKRRFKDLMERIQSLKVPEEETSPIASKVIRILFVSSFFIF